MAEFKIRKDLDGVVYLDDGRKLVAGDTIPDGVAVGAHLLSKADRDKIADWLDAEKEWNDSAEARARRSEFEAWTAERDAAAAEQAAEDAAGKGGQATRSRGGSKGHGSTAAGNQS